MIIIVIIIFAVISSTCQDTLQGHRDRVSQLLQLRSKVADG